MGEVRVYTFKNNDTGEVLGVEAKIIADNYAKYYQEKNGEDYQENYEAMIHWFDTNDYEFADWAKNNMDYDDIKQSCFVVRRENQEFDMQEVWVNGEYSYESIELKPFNQNHEGSRMDGIRFEV